MDQKHSPEVVRQYISFLKKRITGIKKVYIFGSYAKGMFHEDSDIDIAVVFDHIDDVFETQVELMKLRRQFDTRIEPHPLSMSDFDSFHPLANEILAHGVEIS